MLIYFITILYESVDGQASVTADDLSGDIRSQVAGEEERYVGDIGVETAAAQRNLCHPVFAHIFRKLLSHRRLNEAGSHSVATYVA